MEYVLGVDGGNTKTIALLAQPNGQIVGVGRGGCSDIYNGEVRDGRVVELDRAIDAALTVNDIDSTSVCAAALSMAGADYAEDFADYRAAVERYRFGREAYVVNDAIGALRAGTLAGTGVVVVCGTGAATGARSADGRIWHSSFWQDTQGAEELGLKALNAIYRAELGMAAPTMLTERILAFLGQPSVEEVLHAYTRRNATPVRPGLLARMIHDVADEGDPTARRILIDHGTALGDYAWAAARQVGLEGAFPLILAGGVFRHVSPLLADTLVAQVQSVFPEVEVMRSRFEPAVGALLLAFEQLGVAVDETLLERIAATLPDASFYST